MKSSLPCWNYVEISDLIDLGTSKDKTSAGFDLKCAMKEKKGQKLRSFFLVSVQHENTHFEDAVCISFTLILMPFPLNHHNFQWKKLSQFSQSHKHVFNLLKIKFEQSKGRDRSPTHLTAGSNFHKEKSCCVWT